ncbi:recombinase family protein [Streptomyces griseoluteus]|uniref:recombinase family protein n=1 Tax=Streptomyces griseoluteus TaxID=29306 RepID=UPI003405E01F
MLREVLRDRAKSASVRKSRGLPPTGPRCFGYTADGAELVEDEAAEVKDCFHALLAGATLSGMAAHLNERGILNRNGKPWSRNAVRGVLLNGRYAGLRQYWGELYPGKWPVIVDEATWREAKHLLEDESRATSPGPGRRWLLSGIAWCGICDDGTTVTSGSRGGPKGTRGLTVPEDEAPGARYGADRPHRRGVRNPAPVAPRRRRSPRRRHRTQDEGAAGEDRCLAVPNQIPDRRVRG